MRTETGGATVHGHSGQSATDDIGKWDQDISAEASNGHKLQKFIDSKNNTMTETQNNNISSANNYY